MTKLLSLLLMDPGNDGGVGDESNGSDSFQPEQIYMPESIWEWVLVVIIGVVLCYIALKVFFGYRKTLRRQYRR